MRTIGPALFLAASLAAGTARAQGVADAQLCYSGRYDVCASAGDAYHEAGEASYAFAAELYRFGCDHGDARSCRALGWVYQQEPGHGVVRSLPDAHRYYQLACNGGYALACYDLGTLYWTGEGVPQCQDTSGTVVEALQRQHCWPIGQSYYERACSMRHADACREVAYIYGRAMGVPRDFARMTALLRQACDLGNTTACDELRDPAGAALRADADESGGGLGGLGGLGVQVPPPVVGMPEAPFRDVLARFHRDSRTAAQLSLARDLASGGVQLSCQQIALVMQTSAIDSTRVQLATTLWPRALDPQNFYLLPAALQYEGSRTLLRQLTGQQ